MNLRQVFLLAVMLACINGTACAAVIRVEKDGSGDYTVIQDAVDASADGDVIMIGPGRYDDYEVDPWLGNVRVFVKEEKSLTFIGQPEGEVIIGPLQYSNSNRDWGLASYSGSHTIRIKGLRFENLNEQGAALECDYIAIENCEFSYCDHAIHVTDAADLIVSNCKIADSADTGILCGANRTVVQNTVFLRSRLAAQCYGGSNDIIFVDCIIDGEDTGRGGIFFDNCGGLIEGCEFRDLIAGAIECRHGYNVTVANNVIERIDGDELAYGKAINLYNGLGSFTAYGNIISESDVCFHLGIGAPEIFDVTGNHFFRDEANGGFYINADTLWNFYETHFDFSGNYWGTTDLDEVSQWIFDGHDSEDTTIFIDYLPMADGPVTTESATLGRIKAMFR